MVLIVGYGGDLRHLHEANASHLFLPTVVEHRYYMLKNTTLSLNRQNFYNLLMRMGKNAKSK